MIVHRLASQKRRAHRPTTKWDTVVCSNSLYRSCANVQTRLMGHYNGKWPFSLVYVLKPLITAINAITWPLQVQGWGSRTNCIKKEGWMLSCMLCSWEHKLTDLKASSELGRLSHVRLKGGCLQDSRDIIRQNLAVMSKQLYTKWKHSLYYH